MAEPEFDPSTGWWYIRYRTEKGKRAKKTLKKDPRWTKGGTWPPRGKKPKTPPDVQVIARPFQDLDMQAKLGKKIRVPRATDLDAFFQKYMTSYRVASRPRSVLVLKKAIDHFLTFCKRQGLKSLESINRAQCREYMEARRLAGAKYNTVKSEKAILSGAWTRALEDELVDANPWSRNKVPGQDDSVATPHWTPDEVAAIEACLRGWAKDVFIVGVHCGFRIQALLNLRWKDVRWSVPGRKFGQLVCRKEWSKNKKEYSVPLVGRLHDHLADMNKRAESTAPEVLLFIGDTREASKHPDKAMPRGTFARRIAKAIRAAKVTDKGHVCHAMRATFATDMAAKGINPRTIQSWMSHASSKETDRYVGHTKAADEAEAEKLEGLNGQTQSDLAVSPPA